MITKWKYFTIVEVDGEGIVSLINSKPIRVIDEDDEDLEDQDEER